MVTAFSEKNGSHPPGHDAVTRAATILRLLGNETIQFNTRSKKSEPAIQKQLNIDVKSTTKFYFFFKYMNMFIYFTNIRCFHFCFLPHSP